MGRAVHPALSNGTAVWNQPRVRSRVGQHLLERIGKTSLPKLGRILYDFPNLEVYAKAEWFNPGGSVKDWAAYSMIRDGEAGRTQSPGK